LYHFSFLNLSLGLLDLSHCQCCTLVFLIISLEIFVCSVSGSGLPALVCKSTQLDMRFSDNLFTAEDMAQMEAAVGISLPFSVFIYVLDMFAL